MKLVKDEIGQTILVIAVFVGLVALGFLAFVLDAGHLFRQKRMAQAAADAAALAAAEEVAAGYSANQQNAANRRSCLSTLVVLCAQIARDEEQLVRFIFAASWLARTIGQPKHTEPKRIG